MFVPKLLSLTLAVLGLATNARAQLASATACAASCHVPALEITGGFTLGVQTTDLSAFVAVYTHTFLSCSGIALQSIILTAAASGNTYTCTPVPTAFSITGLITATCAITQGQMAALGTYNVPADWSIAIKVGTGTGVTTTNTFKVLNLTPPASPGARRRRAAIEAGEVLPDGFSCGSGMTACPVPGRRALWECLDTMSDINACGGCPGTSESRDCAIMRGVDRVACVAGTCAIQSCDKYHAPTADGALCVRKRARVRFQ